MSRVFQVSVFLQFTGRKKNYMKRTGFVKNCTTLLWQYHVWFRGCLMNSRWNLNNTTFFSRPTQLRYFKPRINFCCDVMIDTKTDKSGLGFPRKQNCKEIWASKNMATLARGKRFRLLVVQLDFKRMSCHLRFSQKKQTNKKSVSKIYLCVTKLVLRLKLFNQFYIQ